MKVIYDQYNPEDTIPVREHLKNKKLKKYLNRETSAAIVAVSKLLAGNELPTETPFYYANGLFHFEEYGLKKIVTESLDQDGIFSDEFFFKQGIPQISPLTSFKILQNMTLAFVAIENNLTGDNAVVYVSADSLLAYLSHAPPSDFILIGAGKVHNSGFTESGFAMVTHQEIGDLSIPGIETEAIELFRNWDTN
jgi:hypothetical protein